MRRRLVLFFCIVLTALLVGAATLPWWLGAAMGRIGAARGLTFARYERIGYMRFALHDVEFRRALVRVTATRIEADTPLLFWWRAEEIEVGNWRVEVAKAAAAAAPPVANGGWLPLRKILNMIAAQLDRWAPRVKAQAGTVHWPGGQLAAAAVIWRAGTLSVPGLAFGDWKADAAGDFHPDAISLALEGTDASAKLESRGDALTGTVTAWGQRAELNARFAERGWLPAEATVRADDWTVPGEKLKLGEYYSLVQGRGKIEWRERKLAAELVATGKPVPGKSAPPLDLVVRGQGDEQAFTIEALDAKLPGVVVRLSQAVTVERSGKFRDSGAQFSIEVDLARLPWLTAKGMARGEARWTSQPGEAPKVEFDLAARDVAAAKWAASLVEARGQFEWPRVRVTAGALVGTKGEQLSWRGGWDFATRQVLDGHAEGRIRRATVARWVPAETQFEVISLRAEAAGAWPNLVHAGQARADGVVFRAFNPLGVTLTWAGRGPAIESFTAEATAGKTKLAATGALGAEEVRLTQLELAQGGEVRLALTGPATIRWRPPVAVESLHLAGPGAALDATLTWGPAGRLELAATHFSSAWLSELGVLGGPAWTLTSLAAKGAWDRGPMTFSAEGMGEIELGDGKQAVMRAKARGDARSVTVEELSVIEAEKRVVKATGRLPLRIFPAAEPIVAFAEDGALDADVTTEPNAGFWREWAVLTGLELEEPEAVARVSGTWARPKGEVRVKAARIAMDAARFKRPMPQVQSLDLRVTGDADEVRLERLNVRIAGQELRARGKLPVAEGKWRELFSSPVALARGKAEGRIEIPDAEVAALAPFLPLFVAPRGWLQADVAYRDGKLNGEVTLHAAATRPLGPLGVLQDVNAEIALVENKIELRSVTAVSGGENVTLSGTVAWPALTEWKAGTPDELKFAVSLKGDNLPFVRDAGALVRGDVDLTLTSPERGTPVLAGTVRLRRSLFLSDIRALLPGGTRSKAHTPPYFSVEAAPYEAWRLKIGVEGERFMTVRTALFNGVASARIQLQGTLGEPVMRGEATIDEGAVKLPFATFAVQEGRVSLQPEQGIEPELTLVGTARRLGYDLRMEATGPASHPTVVFSSSPPLESGQVLLMVMAGESPKDEINFSDRQRVSRLGTFLGQSLLARLGGDSDRGDRLTIVTGEEVSRQGRETYEIEYRLDDRWSLTAEYDQFDDLNAGVKWRVFSKGGTREEQKK